MSLLRAFIAIEIPLEIHKAIEQETALLREALPKSLIRWIPTGNIHLTLKFLGDVSPSNVDMLAQFLSTEVSQHSALELQFGGLGVFPNPKRPRVIWIGIQAPDGLAGLAALHRGIEAATAKLGYPPEKRPFSPHLTVGRIKKNIGSTGIQKVQKTLEDTEIGMLGSAQVISLHLFKSDLKPTGAVYTRMHTAAMRNE